MLQPGTKAPDFILPDQAGARTRLAGFYGKPVVIFFYPRDQSLGCTREACAFRDAHAEFRSEGAVVLGVSADGTESHRNFAQKHELPYRLLTDQGGRVASEYGVPRALGLIPGRATFVVDSTGVIRYSWSSQLATARHAGQALAALRQVVRAQGGNGT